MNLDVVCILPSAVSDLVSAYIGRDAQLLVGGGALHDIWKEPATLLGGVAK
jgi:hypothetical protein